MPRSSCCEARGKAQRSQISIKQTYIELDHTSLDDGGHDMVVEVVVTVSVAVGRDDGDDRLGGSMMRSMT